MEEATPIEDLPNGLIEIEIAFHCLDIVIIFHLGSMHTLMSLSSCKCSIFRPVMSSSQESFSSPESRSLISVSFLTVCIFNAMPLSYQLIISSLSFLQL